MVKRTTGGDSSEPRSSSVFFLHVTYDRLHFPIQPSLARMMIGGINSGQVTKFRQQVFIAQHLSDVIDFFLFKPSVAAFLSSFLLSTSSQKRNVVPNGSQKDIGRGMCVNDLAARDFAGQSNACHWCLFVVLCTIWLSTAFLQSLCQTTWLGIISSTIFRISLSLVFSTNTKSGSSPNLLSSWILFTTCL